MFRKPLRVSLPTIVYVRGEERQAGGLYKARETIWSGSAKATKGRTQNSIKLGAFFIATSIYIK